MSEHLTKEQTLHVTAVLVPSPELLRQGVTEFRTLKTIEMRDIGTELADMIQTAFESNVFAYDGTVVFLIQPIKKVTQQ